MSTPPQSPLPKSNETEHRQVIKYSPVVSLMVKQNSLKNCLQIKDMYMQCTSVYYSAENEPFLCQTAKQYHAQCLSGEKI